MNNYVKTQKVFKMAKFDRNLQKELLERLNSSFPKPLARETYTEIANFFEDNDHFVANLLYLEEHGLIHSGLINSMGGYALNSGMMKITAKGIDFIQQDGGLSAILNVTTIKFHRDAVIVLEDLIAISNLNDADKEKAKSVLGELSTDALKTVVQTVTTAGLAVLMQ